MARGRLPTATDNTSTWTMRHVLVAGGIVVLFAAIAVLGWRSASGSVGRCKASTSFPCHADSATPFITRILVESGDPPGVDPPDCVSNETMSWHFQAETLEVVPGERANNRLRAVGSTVTESPTGDNRVSPATALVDIDVVATINALTGSGDARRIVSRTVTWTCGSRD